MNNMRTWSADVLYGLAIAAVATALFIHTFSDRYEFNPLIESVSTVFFPRIILGGIIACSLGLMIKGFQDSSEGDRLPSVNLTRAVLVLGASAATAAGLWYVGYFYVMPIGIFLTGWALGYPNKLILAATAIVATIVVWVALGHFAAVTFPTEFRLELPVSNK